MVFEWIEIARCEQQSEIHAKIAVFDGSLVEIMQCIPAEQNIFGSIIFNCARMRNKTKGIAYESIFSSPSSTSMMSEAKYLRFRSNTIESPLTSSDRIISQNFSNGLSIFSMISCFLFRLSRSSSLNLLLFWLHLLNTVETKIWSDLVAEHTQTHN